MIYRLATKLFKSTNGQLNNSALDRVGRNSLSFRLQYRKFSTPAPLDPKYTEGEAKLHEKLVNALNASALVVSDISGGCGSMYSVQITSPKFQGLSVLKQHRMVKDVLKDDIKQMHGIQIKTFTE